MFRALADPFRLQLFGRLSGGEVCVCELVELEDEKPSTKEANALGVWPNSVSVTDRIAINDGMAE
jgi:DNA-binding transcriptional ArsR family regulator